MVTNILSNLGKRKKEKRKKYKSREIMKLEEGEVGKKEKKKKEKLSVLQKFNQVSLQKCGSVLDFMCFFTYPHGYCESAVH